MNALLEHLVALPIVVPLLTGAVLLLLTEEQRVARSTLAFTSVILQLAVAVVLLYLTSDAAPFIWGNGIGVYTLGGWPAPFGIVLVADRLSAVMLTLEAVLSLAVLAYSVARWDRPGQPFHSLLQFLMMGLNGAFLTGDLFNLFVFVEILLAASYGLMLRYAGATRVGMGLHYLVVNILASVLFLVGVAMIYGVAGTLNMADLARRFTTLAPDARTLFDTGAAILGVAFLIKAGSWPLNLWLPGTYSVAVAPVGAAFALMTKVGVYALLRVGTLMSEDEAAASMLGVMMFYFGIATLLAGTIGMLAAHHLGAVRELLRHRLDGHPARGARARHRGVDDARAVLLDRVVADDGHVLHAERHDGAHAQRAIAGGARRGARAVVAVPSRRSECAPRIRTAPTTTSAWRFRARSRSWDWCS